MTVSDALTASIHFFIKMILDKLLLDCSAADHVDCDLPLDPLGDI